MKLWLKISVVCTAVLLLIVSISSALMFIYSRDKILSVATDSTIAQQENLVRSYSQMISYYGKDDIEPIARRSLALYCFKQIANKTAILKSGDDTLYSNIAFDPAPLFPEMGIDQQTFTGVVDGRNVLIAGSNATLLSQTYAIYIVRDITDINTSLSQLLLKFILISAVGIVAGAFLVVLFVRLFSRPLKGLSLSSRRIAQGEYAERVEISSKDEIAELAQDFNKMAQAVETNYHALKEMTERQQLFIGSITHEFKTPLTSVIGHSETLLCTNMSPDVVNKSLLHIYEQCKWLERLTQKLLKLMTIQETITLQEESVSALLDALQYQMREPLRKRNITLLVHNELESLQMDVDLMLSLLVNLVDNAAKASNEGQAIELNAYENTIEIIDHGIGMPEEELQHITEAFYMVDKSRSKKLGGSGLGLALAQKIADAHGAKLQFDSKPNRGTQVKVIFPVDKNFTS